MRSSKLLFMLWSMCSESFRDADTLASLSVKYAAPCYPPTDMVCVHRTALSEALANAEIAARDLYRVIECSPDVVMDTNATLSSSTSSSSEVSAV